MLLAVLAGIAPFVLAATPAAASIPSGYQITVSESTPTITYDESPNLIIRASLTLPASDPGLSPNPIAALDQFYLLIDGQKFLGQLGDLSGSSGTIELTVNTVGGFTDPLPAGQHSVSAQYASRTAGLVTSTPITLTVQQLAPDLSCGISDTGPFSPGSPLTFGIRFDTFVSLITPIDPRSGTFAITFAGAQTFTRDGLVADASGSVVAAVPPSPGVYAVTCSFSGNANVAPVQGLLITRILTVSLNHQIDGIVVHTDPTPVRDNVTINWNIAVQGASGLPAPTGTVRVVIGNEFTPFITLGSGGSVTFQTNPATGLAAAGSMRVLYSGDTVYGASNVVFPLTGSPAPSPSATPAGGNSFTPVSLSSIAPPMTGYAPTISRAATDPEGLTSASWMVPLVLGTLILLGACVTLWRRRRPAGQK